MTMQTYALSPARIDRFKGEILKHAVPQETLCRQGRQVRMPKNSSKTYSARRFLPYGATAGANRNTFFGTTTAIDRGNAMVNAHLASEGITPTPDNITPEDVTVVMQQYNCLYGWTDHTADTYEDDIPAQMKVQIGERISLVNEMICFGALKANTNKFYGGTGTSRATVNGTLTLNMVRKMARSLQAQHGKMVSNVLKAGPNYATQSVAGGYFVYCHTDLEPVIRDIVGFIPAEKYASGTPMPNELGAVERFRFITSPEFVAVLDGGAAVGATGLQSNLGTSVDVYQFIVCAAEGWSQVALRGKESMDVTFLPTGMKSKSDPHGQRGYAGAIWWKAVMVENPGWVAVGEVGIPAL